MDGQPLASEEFQPLGYQRVIRSLGGVDFLRCRLPYAVLEHLMQRLKRRAEITNPFFHRLDFFKRHGVALVVAGRFAVKFCNRASRASASPRARSYLYA